MAIEILEYIPQSNGVCIGTFTVRFSTFQNLTVTEFRHCKKGEREWVDLPQKFQKNSDGTWAKPTPKVYFKDSDHNDALKRAIIAELHKLPKTEKNNSDELPF